MSGPSSALASQASPLSPGWAWLLGTTPSGGYRHVPFRATDPGQGQDPALEPRVEVIRRLIAYPTPAFETLVAAIAAADGDPAHAIRWACHRASGAAPARPYWLTFLRPRDGGRRFYVGLELFDRDRIGLWFFSGFLDHGIPDAAKAPFPERPEVSLPRFVVTAENATAKPFGRWIGEAFSDVLAFDMEREKTLAVEEPGREAETTLGGAAGKAGLVDASAPIDNTLTGGTASEAPSQDALELRSARARLVVCPSGHPPSVVPLARLATSFGRDIRCDVAIDDKTVSNEHARIVWREGTPVVEDLGSKNGTRVEGRAARKGERAPLADEGLVVFGKVACLFVRDAEETLPPGAKPVERHEVRLKELLAQQKLTPADAEKARADARARGVTPGEALVLAGRITPEAWRGLPPVALQGGQGCSVLLAAVLLILLALAVV